jgi:hypothetical protein
MTTSLSLADTNADELLSKIHPSLRESFIPFPDGEWTESDLDAHFPGWRDCATELAHMGRQTLNAPT